MEIAKISPLLKQTLEGHAQNISAVTFHPELPIILTGSEDGTFRVWHANTYRFEHIFWFREPAHHLCIGILSFTVSPHYYPTNF